MTQLNTKLKEGNMLLRVLCYGPAKSKKTWWAGKAAEAGFNVTVLDGDNGWQILNNILPEAQERINVIELVDTMKNAVFCVALTQLLKDSQLVWNEKLGASSKMQPTNATAIVDLEKLTTNDVLVIDSWTALVWSLVLRYAKENGVDLTDPEKADREFYSWGNSMVKWMLKNTGMNQRDMPSLMEKVIRKAEPSMIPNMANL